MKEQSFKYQGVTRHLAMSWKDHVDAISVKIKQRIALIRRIRSLLPLKTRISLYNAIILPLLEYVGGGGGGKNNDTIPYPPE